MAQSNHSAKRVKHGAKAVADDLPVGIEKDGWRWTVGAGLGGLPDRLARALCERDRSGRIFKSSRLRTVRKVAVDSPGDGSGRLDRLGAVVVKEHTSSGPAAILRAIFLGPPAAREWRIVRFLHGRGVAVPEPLGMGLRGGGLWPAKSGIIALEAVEGAVTLEDLLLGRGSVTVSRRHLARRAGLLVCAMHDAGVGHPDLHAANLLVSPEGALKLIDFHSARIARKPLSFRARMKDLIPFAGAFLVCAGRTDRLRFFKAYCKGLAPARPLKAAARDLESAAWRRLRKFLKKYDRRPLKSGKAFAPLRVHGRRGMSDTSPEASELARFLGPDPIETLGREASPIKVDRGSSVYSLPFGAGRFVVKVYDRPGVANWIKRLAGRCRARAAWTAGHRLRARLLPAPRPVLFLSDPPLSFSGRSLIVFEEAVGMPTLDTFARHAPPAAMGRTSSALAGNIARMHNFFLTNRDLKAQNILVDREGAPLFVDPDGVAEAASITIDVMARDLMRLNASFLPGGSLSATDRVRFLHSYARARRLGKDAVRALHGALAKRTLAKWATWRRASKI